MFQSGLNYLLYQEVITPGAVILTMKILALLTIVVAVAAVTHTLLPSTKNTGAGTVRIPSSFQEEAGTWPSKSTSAPPELKRNKSNTPTSRM